MSKSAAEDTVCRVPVARDTERFRLLAGNGRPVLPAGFSAPLGDTISRVLIDERLSTKKGAKR